MAPPRGCLACGSGILFDEFGIYRHLSPAWAADGFNQNDRKGRAEVGGGSRDYKSNQASLILALALPLPADV